ncbi:GspE/PulE family protein [Candidatus Eisenbacteria bacterium]|uniref:GspE/PulE family protein n=1 Tax=Eiseniibacteriota bacterium TaxID=2212470 RepID=A0ABV6YL09_UNCEI
MRPPLDISPIHAEYYCIQFQEWDGTTARLLSGKPDNESRRAEIELVLGHSIELIPVSAERVSEIARSRFGIGASSVTTIPGSNQKPLHTSTPPASATHDPKPGDGVTDRPGSPTRPSASSESHTPTSPRLTPEPSIVHFVNRLIQEAFQDRATDIHIEPYENRVDIRYRIDGVLHRIPVPPEVNDLHRSIVSRLKILSHLDIAEQRLPQDGRFRFIPQGGPELDIRISILPTPFGEAVDLRLLTTQQVYTGLGSLGLSETNQEAIGQILQRPHGVVLVTGPTGSGKTTSLYAFLTILNQTDHKIITIEDPIEYQVPGITQIQVNPKIELNFARGLRSMLRHDPDIMMVGEIRDYETADTTIQVALTGHLVFSTVHTNDAPATPARLINMGVEPYLVASSLECVIAQRLVRLVCENCRELVPAKSNPMKQEVAEHIRTLDIPWDGVLGQGRGCEKCKGTGYRGRTAIYEILPVTEGMQAAILKNAAANTLRAVAEEEGFRTMRHDGLTKVAEKKTTYDEVLRVTRKEVY